MPTANSIHKPKTTSAANPSLAMCKANSFPGILARTALLAAGLCTLALPLNAADLSIGEGVVVKGSSGASLVVRDSLHAKGAIFTSLKDDSALNQSNPTAQTAAPGDWSGIKVEASVTSSNLVLNSATVRYAGANSAAGVELRKTNPSINALLISDSITGLRITDGAIPSLTGLSLINNTTGLELLSNAKPTISNADIHGNTSFGISNLTPANIIIATGNWWGDASGPNDVVANAAGRGDKVSSGVNYANWLGAIPLIDPQFAVANARYYTQQANVQFTLACRNAVEYRIAENGNFNGVAFVPLTASATYTLSSGDGIKNVSVQYRGIGGAIVSASLPQGLLYDTQGPSLSVTNPAPGSFLTKPISIDATASDPAGVARVEFYIDNVLAATDNAAPYSYAWDVTTVADGTHSIKVIATDTVGHSSSDTRSISKGIAPPDTSGPNLSNLQLGGSTITDGATLTKSGTLSLTATDPSGVARVEFLLDNVVFANTSGSYSTNLDLSAITDGPHTLAFKGYDSLNNTSLVSLNITITLAAPGVPSLTRPSNNLVTNQTQQSVTGVAEKQTQVQIVDNASPIGSLITVDANGNYSTLVTLNQGANQLQASARNRGGASALSNVILVTVDSSIPGAPSGLSALGQLGGKVHLTWLTSGDTAVKGYNVYRSPVAFTTIAEATKANSSPLTSPVYDDIPLTDGSYTYRVVAVNALGTESTPSNPVSAVSDKTLPRATGIVYAPTGKTDPVTGRIAQGRVNLTLTVSEALLTTPFLSIAPQNGTPIAVDLTKTSDTTYNGFFNIGPDTPSGTAYAVFSARDLIGNRGTDIDTGASLLIDATGPAVSSIAINPADPIKNDSTTNVTVNFTLTEAMKPGVLPQLSFLLSKAGRTPVAINAVSANGGLNYQASFTLPTDAGQGAVETLQFVYLGQDDLDNQSTTITAPNRFQVYQGALPPAGTPLNFAARAQPGGKVKLTWNAVPDVVAYQLYRQAPNEAALSAYQRVAGTDYSDTTTADGTYRYAIASIRSHNGQESLSAQSATLDVKADAVAPDAPQNLSLSLTGAGIKVLWQAPLTATDVASYKVYRSNLNSITSVAGLTPIQANILSLGYIDPNPSLTEHSYVATAVDAAGNESPISNAAYLNFALLPVNTLNIVQSGTDQPVISWTHSAQTIAGYDILVGQDNAQTKLNTSPLTVKTFTDTGYNNTERRYTVVAIDSNGAQIGRSLTLPNLSAQLTTGSTLKRGIVNNLQYWVMNNGTGNVDNIVVKVLAANRSHASASFSLKPGEGKNIPVIVGGYADLPNLATLTSTLEVTPNAGELVQIVRSSEIDVQDGSLTLGLTTDSFTRGGVGKIRFTLTNPGKVEMEVVTAQGTGSQPSNEMRFKLVDKDNNVLATQAYQQYTGNVVTLANGKTVARLPAGALFTSDPVDLIIPGTAPNDLFVQLEIDQLHYHVGQADQVDIGGLSSRQAVSLIDTAYAGELTGISPASSFGDVPVVITGRAIDRTTQLALANVPLKLVFRVNGFERKFDLYTDAGGLFSYRFIPTASDAGQFKVSVVHPDILDRPDQGQFVINQVVVTPTRITLNSPRNYAQIINLGLTAGDGTTATNVRAVYTAADQPSGSLPPGVNVSLGNPINLSTKQRANLPITISADNTANESGTLILKVLSDEKGTDPLATLRIDYKFSEARASLYPSPSYVETGLARDAGTTEQVSLSNKGLAPAANVKATLLNADSSPAPGWITLATPGSLGSINVGDTRTLDIAISPTSSVPEGIYTFKLHITGDNIPAGDVNIYVSVTQSGIGNALFKAADIYTGTLDKNNKRIAGLANAKIVVQNEQVASVSQTLNSDSLGEAFFTNLPAGSYKFRASAPNHQEVGGRFSIKAGVTAAQDIFLDYNLVTVEWSVKEITIQDKYEINLTATFETNVPAAVVVLQPTSVNIPTLKAGDVYYGEFTLTNYGLVRADNVKAQLPKSDQYIRYEFLTDIPTSLDAKARLTIPYRLVQLQSFEPTASGGGCFSYNNSIFIPYNYACANGTTTSGSANGYWNYYSGIACSGGGGGGVGGGAAYYGGGGGGGGGFGGTAPGFDSLPGAACIPPCPTCQGGNGPN